jgi:hypothetical protein
MQRRRSGSKEVCNENVRDDCNECDYAIGGELGGERQKDEWRGERQRWRWVVASDDHNEYRRVTSDENGDRRNEEERQTNEGAAVGCTTKVGGGPNTTIGDSHQSSVPSTTRLRDVTIKRRTSRHEG